MFRGIDEVDWASLRHAYGSAEDVPGLLRGLTSADPAERQTALDGMYGTVHHEGGVYDATLACVPFLLALAGRAEVRDRAEVVELLVSIGDIDGAPGDLAASTRDALRAGAGVFERLAGDADPGVRRAAPGALVRFLGRPARVLALLRERITVERDDGVLLALAESLGLFARRYRPADDAHAAEAVWLLTELSGPPHGPGLRLAALGQLAGCAQGRLPADLVPTVVRLLRDRSGQRAGAGHPYDCAGPDTLAGRLRRLRPSDEEGSRLLRTLHSALGSRVSDRVALLCGQLTSPDPLDRCNGVWMSAGLFREWRTGHAEPVTLIGNQLGAEESRLHDAAVAVLVELFTLAAPAADHLHALVTYRPELRVRHGERGAPALGGPLKALAQAGDARAVPALAEMLAGPVVPNDLGLVVPHLGGAAVPLTPALRRRLVRVPLDAPDTAERAVPLLSALAALGDVEATPAVLRLLRGMPDALPRRDAVTAAALRALGVLGGAAREAIPDLRGLLRTDSAVAAADALWSVTGDPDAVLPVLVRELSRTEGGHRLHAAAVLGRLGPAARPALPGLRELAASDDAWARTTAACAVWRTAGEAERLLPVLRSAWVERPRTRRTIAECVLALGPAGAPLHEALRAELAAPRRHRGDAGVHGIREDLALLRVCREALAGPGRP
ncbi:HEAT repeat domain-containing protein [Streptomyces sp. NEAU-H22]|uniref:HEAT repeat domain-containing protein n=1 Tax=Streptomyces sp. NEAU-H22 TaxID=2994655 RepID=UPI0022563C1F|nr:HEAT repeat domain-containing protein [Streptomyces sp. NEAU-H22]MCX3290349.1 HEAT repeat domain-containing protein [Streptomyces sp. NEAU-H22]